MGEIYEVCPEIRNPRVTVDEERKWVTYEFPDVIQDADDIDSEDINDKEGGDANEGMLTNIEEENEEYYKDDTGLMEEGDLNLLEQIKEFEEI